MSKAEEKAIAYADNKLQIVDPEFAKSSYLRHNKMGVRLFSGDDIEEAYQDGYYQAEKDNALTWEDIKLIGELFQDVARDGRTNKDLEASFKEDLDAPFKEILRRFLKQKGGKV